MQALLSDSRSQLWPLGLPSGTRRQQGDTGKMSPLTFLEWCLAHTGAQRNELLSGWARQLQPAHTVGPQNASWAPWTSVCSFHKLNISMRPLKRRYGGAACCHLCRLCAWHGTARRCPAGFALGDSWPGSTGTGDRASQSCVS